MPRWLIFALVTVAAWGVWGVLGKTLPELSAVQSQSLSTLGIVPVLAALVLTPNWDLGGRSAKGSLLALAAGLLVGLGNVAYYHSLTLGAKASTAASLTALYPVTTVLLAIVILKERLSAVQWIGVAGALAAIAVFYAGPLENLASGWLLYAVVPIVLWGGSGLLMKLSTQHASPERATFWFLASFIPLAVILLAIDPVAIELGVKPTVRVWLLSFLLGLTYALGNWTVLAAYASGGKASIVTPMAGLYPVVTIGLAVLVLKEPIGRREWIGIGLALSSAVALCFESARKEAPPVAAAAPELSPEKSP